MATMLAPTAVARMMTRQRRMCPLRVMNDGGMCNNNNNMLGSGGAEGGGFERGGRDLQELLCPALPGRRLGCHDAAALSPMHVALQWSQARRLLILLMLRYHPYCAAEHLDTSTVGCRVAPPPEHVCRAWDALLST